jgi:prepilin signal peptidase PulO-like enzyme (type II secretory pathway)
MPASVFDLVRFIVGAGVLLYAARSDLRTRRVGDWCWWAFLALGLVVLEAQLISAGESFLFLLTPFYVAVFFFSLWYEGEVLGDNVRRRDSAVVAVLANIAAVAVFALQLAAGPLDPSKGAGFRHLQLLLIPVMMLVAYMLYRTQLLSGGADAKAFLSLAVLVPFFPDAFLRVLVPPSLFLLICPFVLAVFFNGAFFTLFNPVGIFLYNLARGERGRLMAFAYRVPIAKARRKKFIWISECIVDGRRKLLYFRFRGHTARWKREQLDLLEKEGERKVWVQPQIPFMVQLCAGFIFTFALGNIILYGIVKLISGV